MEQKAKLIIIGLALFTLLCLFLFVEGFSARQNLTRERNSLKTENTNLTAKVDKLTGSIRNYESKIISLTQELENLTADKNNLEKNVRLINPLNYFDLPKILNASDIAIDPKDSKVNQASGKILQYMGAGLPIVCFDKSNNRQYLGEGANYANDFSAQGIAEEILNLASDLPKSEEKGKMNKERAKKFSWDNSAEELDKIYQEIGSK